MCVGVCGAGGGGGAGGRVRVGGKARNTQRTRGDPTGGQPTFVKLSRAAKNVDHIE